MLCTEVSGNINDPSSVIALRRRLGAPFEVDYVDLEWDQVHARRLVVKSGAGRVVEIRLGERVEEIGLKDGDVLGCDVAPDTLAAHASSVEPCAATAPAPASGGKPVVVAVQLRSARVVRIRFTASEPVDPALVARVGWEVGNMHVPLFRGEAGELMAPHSDALQRLLASIPGIQTTVEQASLDPAARLSGTGISTVVRLSPALKVVVRKKTSSN